MKILGIGTDIVSIKRFKKTLDSKGLLFKKRIFSKNEVSYCEKKINYASYFAKRFAAKEAFSKALGTGIRKGINFKDIEVFNNKDGKPYIKLKGTTRLYLLKKIKKKNYSIYLSLYDDKSWAQGTVVISY